MRRITGTILILFALGACESIIDVETPSDGHKIVAHSFFTADSVWTVNAGLSLHTSGFPVTLSHADPGQTIVVVSDDRGHADILQYYPVNIGAGLNYRSAQGLRPRPGVTYTLRVEMPGFISSETSSPPAPVEATAQLPERVAVQNIAYSNDNGTASLRFAIEDPPGANYYRLELFQVGPEDTGTIINDTLYIPQAVEDVFNYRQVDFRSTDPSFHFHYGEVGNLEQKEEINFDFYGRAVFSDDLFDGTLHDIEIAFEPYTYPGFQPRFAIIFSTLSHEMFTYLHTLDRHQKSAPAYSSEVYPIPVYTNIKNGFGVFGGYVTDTYRFDEDGNEW